MLKTLSDEDLLLIRSDKSAEVFAALRDAKSDDAEKRREAYRRVGAGLAKFYVVSLRLKLVTTKARAEYKGHAVELVRCFCHVSDKRKLALAAREARAGFDETVGKWSPGDAEAERVI